MIGKPELIAEAEKSTEIDTSHADAYMTGVAALSLANWVHSAKLLMDTPKGTLQAEWNLDCIGNFGIPEDAFEAHDDPSAAFIAEDGILRVLGDIEEGFAKSLREAVYSNPGIETVALGSGGGNVVEALEARYFIRSQGLDTTLWNNCYSACTIVFMGGRQRTIWSPYPRLGFHQASQNSEAVPLTHPIYHLIEDYSTSLGYEPGLLFLFMARAEPHEFYYPDLEDLCDTGIATWIQRACWASN